MSSDPDTPVRDSALGKWWERPTTHVHRRHVLSVALPLFVGTFALIMFSAWQSPAAEDAATTIAATLATALLGSLIVLTGYVGLVYEFIHRKFFEAKPVPEEVRVGD